MNTISIYAITIGGVFFSLFVASIFPYLTQLARIASVLTSKYLNFPFLLRRHRFVGPWTYGAVLMHGLYVAVNIFCLCFQPLSWVDTARRAGTLSMVNMVTLFATGDLSVYTCILGISRHICQKIHRAIAWMVVILLGLHIILTMTIQKRYPLDRTDNIFALVGTGCVVGLILFSLSPIRRIVYEIFLRAHQIQGYALLYACWRHLPFNPVFPRLYVIIALAFLLLALLVQSLMLLYTNKLFSSRGCPRALVACASPENDGKNGSSPLIKVRIALSRPMRIEAGQYINIWMPAVNWWSWAQIHPFTVISWSNEARETVDLLIQPRHGFSANLLQHALDASPGSASFLALITGPHGVSERVDRYETVVLVVSGMGIAAAVPYLKKLIYSYNTSASQTRRVHLVWQLETFDIAIAAQSELNSLLEDDSLKETYILTLSVYVESGKKTGGKMTLGDHDRAFVYIGNANYEQIIHAEMSGDLIERLPNVQEEQGESLVIVAASNEIRDRVQAVLQGYVDQKMRMAVLEYQP